MLDTLEPQGFNQISTQRRKDAKTQEKEWERAENVESGKLKCATKIVAGGFSVAAGRHRVIELARGSGSGLRKYYKTRNRPVPGGLSAADGDVLAVYSAARTTAVQRSRELTQRESRRTLDCNMPAWFYVNFAIVKKIVADFWANEKIPR